MRVRAGDSKGADSGPQRPIRLTGPIRRLGDHANRQPVPIQVRVRVLKVQVLRDQTVAHGQDDLDQRGDPRRGFEMTDIGLDRADQ